MGWRCNKKHCPAPVRPAMGLLGVTRVTLNSVSSRSSPADDEPHARQFHLGQLGLRPSACGHIVELHAGPLPLLRCSYMHFARDLYLGWKNLDWKGAPPPRPPAPAKALPSTPSRAAFVWWRIDAGEREKERKTGENKRRKNVAYDRWVLLLSRK